ncbi:MAG: Ldh family oxidoreductase [Rhodospirillales bacterium]|jgi:L-2-hydroxycarboxylate dehydrogenase (NAD+)|nr:Ldh family oxidoreductase [Rhodospirillales bacterium]
MSVDTATRPSERACTVDALKGFARDVFQAAGMTGADAGVMADCLVRAHLRGFDTHGLGCIPLYVDNLLDGRVNARPEIGIERRGPWAVRVDANNGMGHVAATRTMEAVLDSVRSIGIGVGSVRNSNHLGAACLYPLMAVEQGYIGMAMINSSVHVTPWGSRDKLFGTNPIAIAAPAGNRPPFVLDMATSAAARRKFRLALELGEPIPEGWAVDADGVPTIDPATALKGAALPVGGAKGSGLGMAVEIMAGVLSGAAFAGDVLDLFSNQERQVNSGNFLMAMDVSAFMDLGEFETRMDTLITRVKALQTAPDFDEVRFPGERGARLEAERLKDGIPLPESTARALREVGSRLGISFPG